MADEWRAGVTHVVCGVDAQLQGRARRTLKYLLGITHVRGTHGQSPLDQAPPLSSSSRAPR